MSKYLGYQLKGGIKFLPTSVRKFLKSSKIFQEVSRPVALILSCINHL